MQNNYIFGATVEDIAKLKKEGYKPMRYISNPNHRKAVESLVNGTFSDGGSGGFQELYDSLIKGASWHAPDNYFVLYDLGSFVQTLIKICNDYADKKSFAEKQLKNVANSAYFSSDRTIKEYAKEIWDI